MPRHLSVAATLALAVIAASTNPAAAARSPICTRGQTTVERDPRGLLPLTDMNPIGAATTAVLRYGQKTSRPQVRAAMFAIDDHERGEQARLFGGLLLVNDLPDVVPAPEASDEVHALRRSLGWKRGSIEDIDDDRSLPHTHAAGIFRLRSTLTVGDRERRSPDLRTARLLPVSNDGGRCRANRVHVAER